MQVFHEVELKDWHTLAGQAVARELMIIEAQEELQALNAGDVVIGSGSNVVFLPWVEERLVRLNLFGVSVVDENKAYVWVRAMAGENWHAFVQEMVARGLGGVENLALIPGTVGAAPVQNIGAYGVEVCEVIAQVEAYDRWKREWVCLQASECGFVYRGSFFKSRWLARYVIVAVVFVLRKNPILRLDYAELAQYPTPLNSIEAVFFAVVAIRQNKLPDPKILPNAGSFFHNPVVDRAVLLHLEESYSDVPRYVVDDNRVKIPAAWLIERCGFKGYREGNVGIYAHHALVLINYEGGGDEIYAFAQKIIAGVQARFGITLTIEPRLIGQNKERFDGTD